MQVVVDAFGARVGIQQGMLCVWPKDEPPTKIPFREIDCLHLGQGVSVSSDALRLCIQNDVRVLISDRSGQPVGHVWHGRFGSVSTIRRQQLVFAEHPVGMNWVREGVLRKINEQIAFAYSLAYQSCEQGNVALIQQIRTAEAIVQKVKGLRLFDVELDTEALRASFRGWEGSASRAYFKCLSQSLPSSYQFEQRERRPAKDRFNCALNYMYGILYGMVEMALIKAGIDPYIGVLHTDGYNKPSMVLDAIEPYRIWADRTAFMLCQSQALTHECFEEKDGGLWLAKQGKPIVIDAFFAYLEEILPSPQGPRKRKTLVSLDAQRTAQLILHTKK